MKQHPELITAADTAAILRVRLGRVYDLAKSGRIPVIRLGRQLRFDRAAIIRLLSSGGEALPGGWRREP